MRPICSICWLVFVIGLTSGQKCNYPATADRIPNRNDPFSYLECGAPGYYMVRQCPDGTSFDSTSMKCGQMPHWIIKGPQKPPQGGYNPQPFPPQGGYNPKPYPTSGGSNPFFPPPKSFNNNNNQIETYLPRNNNNNQWNGNNQWNNNNNNNNRNNLPDYNNYGGNRGNDYNNYGGPNNNNNNNHNNNNNNGQYPNQPNLQVLTPSTFKPPPPRPFQPQIKAFEPRQNPPPFQPSPFINNQLPPPPTGNGNFAERVSGPNMVLPPDPGSEYPIELYSSCRIGEMCPHNINRLQYCAYSGSKFLQCSGQGWILQECPGGAVFRNGRCTNGFEEIFQPGAPPLLPTNNNNIRPPPPPPRPPQTVTQNSIYNPNTPIQLVRLPGPPPFTQNPIQNSFNPNPNHNNNRPNPNPFDADNFFARKGRNPTRSYVIDNNQPIFSNRVMHIKHNRPWYRPAKTQRDQGQQDSPKTVAELDGRFMEQQNRLNIAPIVLHKNWQLIPASSPIHQASAALTKE